MSYTGTGLYYVHADTLEGKKKGKQSRVFAEHPERWDISEGIASAGEECLCVSKPGSLTHISEEACQLMAY